MDVTVLDPIVPALTLCLGNSSIQLARQGWQTPLLANSLLQHRPSVDPSICASLALLPQYPVSPG